MYFDQYLRIKYVWYKVLYWYMRYERFRGALHYISHSMQRSRFACCGSFSEILVKIVFQLKLSQNSHNHTHNQVPIKMIEKLILFELVAVIFFHVVSSKESLSNGCDKFSLIVENEPEYFVPRSSYVGKYQVSHAFTIKNRIHHAIPVVNTYNHPNFFFFSPLSLVGIESNNVHTFTSFRFAAQSSNDSTSSLAQTGWFSLMSNDADAQFSPDEINTIIEKNDSDKRSVYVLWTAPTGHSCVIIK